MVKKKRKAKAISKTSVKSYEHGIEAEKQKMTTYTNEFNKTVKSLQNDFKKHRRDIKEAALKMREEGIKKMSSKVNKFKGEINKQIKENKEAVARISDSTKFLISEINKKKKDFQSYTQGPFQSYIKAFWG